MTPKAIDLLRFGFLLLTTGCNTMETPLKTVKYVDIDRFMGNWYVIATIPTFAERSAYNPVEHYTLKKDGTIATSFRYQKNNANGESRELTATGFIRDPSTNAVWGMQFIWPIKADYRIIKLDPNYEITMVGRSKRDYLWIMSRNQPIPEDTLEEFLNFAEEVGYDTRKIQLSSWQYDTSTKPD